MQNNERYHALDAVRAGALLLGVVLHASASFLDGFPIPIWKDTPNVTPTILYYTIHMFRMSTFFLIAGFFARLVVERRGVNAFVKDRAKRIALPFVGFSVVMPIFLIACVVLGTLTHGVESLKALQQLAQAGDSSGPKLDLGHLWFLYYLLMFYALALAVRWLCSLGNKDVIASMADRVVAFVMRGVWAPVLIALPLAIYFLQLSDWNEWLGMPSPFSIVPSLTALICYGVPFMLGWMLNRQTQLLFGLQKGWWVYLVAAVVLTAGCLSIIGTKPFWSGSHLSGTQHLLYAIAYMTAAWCWVLGLIATALRFLNHVSPGMRYLADASYWIYLMHLAVISFFIAVMRPYHWHWSIKFTIMLGGAMIVLLLSYRYLVRFTWLGALLNGRRYPREVKAIAEQTDSTQLTTSNTESY
jgi:glucans biosynthesis protein C